MFATTNSNSNTTNNGDDVHQEAPSSPEQHNKNNSSTKEILNIMGLSSAASSLLPSPTSATGNLYPVVLDLSELDSDNNINCCFDGSTTLLTTTTFAPVQEVECNYTHTTQSIEVQHNESNGQAAVIFSNVDSPRELPEIKEAAVATPKTMQQQQQHPCHHRRSATVGAGGQQQQSKMTIPKPTHIRNRSRSSSAVLDLGRSRSDNGSTDFAAAKIPKPIPIHRRAYSEGASRLLLDADSMGGSSSHSEELFEDLYVLTRQIFQCDHSAIWECVYRETGQRYCVKIMKNSVATRHEIIMLKSVQTHPNIIRLVDVLEQDAKVYVVMELMSGGNLLSRVIQNDGLEEDIVKRLALQLLLGLQHLHGQTISHNDLQPSNILLDGNNGLKIADFGTAALIGKTVVPPRVSKASAAAAGYYRAPEMLHSPESDMWSVGIILFFCLTGHNNNNNDGGQQSVNSTESGYDALLKRIHSVTPWGSRYAKQLITGLLHLDPAIRLTAQEALAHPWLADLQKEAEQHDGSRSRSRHRSWSRGRRRRRVMGSLTKLVPWFGRRPDEEVIKDDNSNIHANNSFDLSEAFTDSSGIRSAPLFLSK